MLFLDPQLQLLRRKSPWKSQRQFPSLREFSKSAFCEVNTEKYFHPFAKIQRTQSFGFERRKFFRRFPISISAIRSWLFDVSSTTSARNRCSSTELPKKQLLRSESSTMRHSQVFQLPVSDRSARRSILPVLLKTLPRDHSKR